MFTFFFIFLSSFSLPPASEGWGRLYFHFVCQSTPRRGGGVPCPGPGRGGTRSSHGPGGSPVSDFPGGKGSQVSDFPTGGSQVSDFLGGSPVSHFLGGSQVSHFREGGPGLRFSGGGRSLVSIKGKIFDTRFGLIHVQTRKTIFVKGPPTLPPPSKGKNF